VLALLAACKHHHHQKRDDAQGKETTDNEYVHDISSFHERGEHGFHLPSPFLLVQVDCHFSAHARHEVLASIAIEGDEHGNALANLGEIPTGCVLCRQQGELAGRRSAQTAVWRICEAMVRLLAPILTFTCEEVWQHLPKMPGRPESVHLAKFPEAGDVFGAASVPVEDRQLSQDWTTLLSVREQAMKALEEERNGKRIGKSLEAQLIITAADPTYFVLKRYSDELRYLFIVSAVTLKQGFANGTGVVHVEVKKADGAKCERCWNYSTHVGEDKTYPTVCERCSSVLKQLEG
jgi:hypothetical protein